MILRRFLALAGLAAALSGAVLTAPEGADAHATDSLHQHGWSEIYAFQPGVHSKCLWGTNVLQFEIPNLMTTPVRQGRQSEYVWFLASLEYYDSSRGWTNQYWDSSSRTYKYLVYTNWQYALATNSGLLNGFWVDYGTKRYTPNSIAFDIKPGFWYRVGVHYSWDADGTQHYEPTNACHL